MTRFLLLSAMLLASCGDVMPIQQTYVAPELLQGSLPALVDEFYSHCPTTNKPQVIALVARLPEDAKDTAAARCTKTSSDGQGMVFIQIDSFLAKTDDQRRWLVAHELLHCSFGIGHKYDGIMKQVSPTKDEAKKINWQEVESLCKN
jgi:hypothetical protein